MKKNICCVLFTLIALCAVYISTFDVIKTEIVTGESQVKYVDSKILSEEFDEEVNDAYVEEELNVKEETIIDEVIVEEKVTYNEVVQETYEEVEATVAIENEILIGKMTGYGPDCYGCSGYLANGMYVGDGTIYYNDSEYGNVRIVAGDKKYKFGTIVKINDSMLAIVLDRGGAIGVGKGALFDLLYQSEAIANENGVLTNAKFEILRNGF